MSTTAQEILLDRQLGGVDATSEPYLVGEDKWIRHHNMRPLNGKLLQVARKVVVDELEPCYPHDVLDIVNLPTGFQDYGHVLLLSREHAWQYRALQGSCVKLKDVTGELQFNYDARYRRWGRTVYNGQAFFTNELNTIHASDGVSVRRLQGDVPAARYLTHFFDHLVVGWTVMGGMVMPGRMQWSNLYNTTQWRPSRGNEADHWDFEEDDNGLSALRGVTGMGKLGDVLFVLTPTSIRPVDYVGLPKVFRVGPNVSGGVGNGLMYGTIYADKRLFFFDTNEFNFFSFDGAQVQPIGGPVQGFLRDNASTDSQLQQKTWAYWQPEYFEVVWNFCSRTSTGEIDLAVAFNYRTNVWYTRSVENVHAFGGRIRLAMSVDLEDGPCDTWEGQCDDQPTVDVTPRMWGTGNGKLLREDNGSDVLTDLLAQETPVLETRDYLYGSSQTYKQLDTLGIHSSYSNSRGVGVELSTRDLHDAAVQYDPPQFWTPKTPYLRLTDLRKTGRIFRFRVSPLSLGTATEEVEQCPNDATPPHGALEVRIPQGTDGTSAPFDATLLGPVGIYYLENWRDPVDVQYEYTYGAPSDADPYTIAQSTDVLADVLGHGGGVLGDLGYDGITEAGWVYTSAAANGWPIAYWPSHVGSTPVLISSGWQPAVRGFLKTLNPQYSGGTTLFKHLERSSQVGGVAGTAYIMTLRVRGVSSLMNYSGGTNNNAYFQTGGTAPDATHDTVRLTLGDPLSVYYLNRGEFATDYNVGYDYTVEIPVTGGSDIELKIDNQNGVQFSGDAYDRAVKVAGYVRTRDIWARVDYSLRLASGYARTTTYTKGGGVRGWKWTGMTQNVRNLGAEK